MGERLLRSFNSKLRDEFLNGEIFYSIKELRVLAVRWRVHYNTIRPHSSLGYRPPAPQTWLASNNTGYGEVETASASHFPTPRRRLPTNIVSVTLTLRLVQKAGQATLKLGEGSEAYAPLAQALIGGLTVSVLLTVFLVPAGFFLNYGQKKQIV